MSANAIQMVFYPKQSGYAIPIFKKFHKNIVLFRPQQIISRNLRFFVFFLFIGRADVVYLLYIRQEASNVLSPAFALV